MSTRTRSTRPSESTASSTGCEAELGPGGVERAAALGSSRSARDGRGRRRAGARAARTRAARRGRRAAGRRAGMTSTVVVISATGTPAASPATSAPASITSVTITSAGRRSSSSITSRATSAARPNIRRSRMRVKPPIGVRASQSLNRSVSGVRSVRCGVRVQAIASAPVASISALSTGSPSTRTSWPRSASARASDEGREDGAAAVPRAEEEARHVQDLRSG